MKISFSTLLFFLILCVSCSTKTVENKKEIVEKDVIEKDDSESTNSSVDVLDEVSFLFKNKRVGVYDTPESDLYIKVNDVEFKVSKIQGEPTEVNKSEFSDLFIPADVKTAILTHWGESTYYYIIQNEKEVKVFEGGPIQTGEDGRWQGYYTEIFSKKLNRTQVK